jgi:hypothetical protein
MKWNEFWEKLDFLNFFIIIVFVSLLIFRWRKCFDENKNKNNA